MTDLRFRFIVDTAGRVWLVLVYQEEAQHLLVLDCLSPVSPLSVRWPSIARANQWVMSLC